MERSIKIFICYAREDQDFVLKLKLYLVPLQREGIISTWYDADISPGQEWQVEVAKHLLSAQIILLLVSPDLMASDYIYSVELQKAMQLHEQRKARVIPIIIRPVLWSGSPIGKLQALPRDARPIISSSWGSLDEAFLNVAEGISLICKELLSSSKSADRVALSEERNLFSEHTIEINHLNDVFMKSGFPHITFVEREDFELLKLSLTSSGRGIVIEGPSGVGKTTALKKAIEEVKSERSMRKRSSKINGTFSMLSARDPGDRDKLESLSKWHQGTVVIDDFHRLEASLREKIADYLKYLADVEPDSKKLVIVGIPQSGQTLVDISFDIATRIDVFKWGMVKDELIIHMIEKGEKALNIEFDRKVEIAFTANGSLNVAQYICFHICHKARVAETQDRYRVIQCDIDTAISNVMADLSMKFGESVRLFAAMGGPRDTTCIWLLQELALSDNGFLSLPLLKEERHNLAYGIEQFTNEKWMDILCKKHPKCMNHLFFDQAICALMADDPQLIFYLKRKPFSTLAKEAGKAEALARRKIFISYSHNDAKWLQRLRVHLTPLEREGILDLWDDTKITAGMKWKDELQTAIDSSTVAVILVSADFLASDFIAEHELPKLLRRAKSGGTTILPLIVSPCLFVGSGVDDFQSINAPDKSLITMTASERERTLVKLAEIISKKLAGKN